METPDILKGNAPYVAVALASMFLTTGMYLQGHTDKISTTDAVVIGLQTEMKSLRDEIVKLNVSMARIEARDEALEEKKNGDRR